MLNYQRVFIIAVFYVVPIGGTQITRPFWEETTWKTFTRNMDEKLHPF
jgi:hypothetical protein